jgi:REP element-mobilizing transposase RayT
MARRFLELVREVKARDRFAGLAWCLMPTHYHLVVRTAEVPLWRSMRLIQGRFAQAYNRRTRSLGSVWQERYKAKVVADGRYLGQVLAYVHLNPVVAGLARTPGTWRWSGHGSLVGHSGEPLADADEVLRLLGKTAGMARRAYRGWLEAAPKVPLPGEPMDRVPWWRRRDDDSPVPYPRRSHQPGRTTGGHERPCLSVDCYLARATAAQGIGLSDLGAERRDRATVRAREVIVLVGMERYRLRTRDLAAEIGRTADQVSRWAGQASRRKAEDPAFRARVENLDAAVAAWGGVWAAPPASGDAAPPTAGQT